MLDERGEAGGRVEGGVRLGGQMCWMLVFTIRNSGKCGFLLLVRMAWGMMDNTTIRGRKTYTNDLTNHSIQCNNKSIKESMNTINQPVIIALT